MAGASEARRAQQRRNSRGFQYVDLVAWVRIWYLQLPSSNHCMEPDRVVSTLAHPPQQQQYQDLKWERNSCIQTEGDGRWTWHAAGAFGWCTVLLAAAWLTGRVQSSDLILY